MKTKKTTVIELYAGPGAGKSTMAAAVFAALKCHGQKVELVTEWCKGWAWDGRKIGDYDQVHILGQQMLAESRLYGKVDYIVTDSPLWLAAYYAERRDTPGDYAAFLRSLDLCEAARRVRVWIDRSPTIPYQCGGRYEDEQAALDADRSLRDFLEKQGINTPWRITKGGDVGLFCQEVVIRRNADYASPRPETAVQKALSTCLRDVDDDNWDDDNWDDDNWDDDNWDDDGWWCG